MDNVLDDRVERQRVGDVARRPQDHPCNDQPDDQFNECAYHLLVLSVSMAPLTSTMIPATLARIVRIRVSGVVSVAFIVVAPSRSTAAGTTPRTAPASTAAVAPPASPPLTPPRPPRATATPPRARPPPATAHPAAPAFAPLRPPPPAP